MKKPTIVFLIPRLGITDRGAEVFVHELAKRLQKDFEIVILTRKSNMPQSLKTNLRKLGVSIVEIGSLSENNLPAGMFYISILKKWLDLFHLNPAEIEMLVFSICCIPYLLSKKFDLLFPCNGVWGSIICSTIRSLRGIPFVYTSLGGIEPLSARQKPNAYIATNPSILRWIKAYNPKIRSIFIPTGVDLKKFHPNGEKANISLPHPIFLTVSALVSEKEVELTIQAVAKQKKGSLLIVGDGPLKSQLFRLAHDVLGKNRYQFVSSSYDRLDTFYRVADVFAFSAPWEIGWSIVHLEALASGLPLVTKREENLEYLLGKKYPLFCDVSNINDYSRALEKATKTKVDGRKYVKNYSWDKVAKKYNKILFRVIPNLVRDLNREGHKMLK